MVTETMHKEERLNIYQTAEITTTNSVNMLGEEATIKDLSELLASLGISVATLIYFIEKHKLSGKLTEWMLGEEPLNE